MSKPILRYGVFTLSLLMSGIAASHAFAQTSLLPSMDNMKIRFGNGAVAKNQPELFPELPAIPGQNSQWKLIQWGQSAIIPPRIAHASRMVASDPVLGRADYTFSSPDSHSHLWIFSHGPNGHPVYELYEKGGEVTAGGGSNLFLSANTVRPAPSLALHPVFSVMAKLSSAEISYDNSQALAGGAVRGNAFVGLVLQFPTARGISTLFMQLPFANSRHDARLVVMCAATKGGYRLLTGGNREDFTPLAFEPDFGSLHLIKYDLVSEWSAITATPFKCQGSETMPTLASIPLSSITIRGVYIGLETENMDDRLHSNAFGITQGNVSVGLQLSNAKLEAAY